MSLIKNECYKLIQEISTRRHPVCLVPGCGKPSVAGHHIFKRDRMGTAFHPDAVLAVCQMHHDFAHANPKEFREIARTLLGDEYEVLRQLSLMAVQFRDQDFRRVKTALIKIKAGLC